MTHITIRKIRRWGSEKVDMNSDMGSSGTTERSSFPSCTHRPLPRHPFLLSHSAHATGGVGSDALCQHPDICPRRMAALLLQPDTQPAVGATHTGAISASGLGDADCRCRSAGRRARSVGNGRSHTLSEWTGCSLRHRLHSLQHHLFIFYRLYSARIVFHIRHQAIPHP